MQQRWGECFEDLLYHKNLGERGDVCVKKITREVEEVAEEEVKTVLKKMKKGKARVPNIIPVEVWLILGEIEVG